MSWLVQRDVEEGRAKLNLSEWDRPQEEPEEAAETVQEGKMPPRTCLLFHPEAALSGDEQQAMVRGLRATLGGSPERERSGREGEREERERRR